LSDGNVHSNINHLKSMIMQAKKDGVRKVRVHALLDGRDVPALSATIYVNDLEAFLSGLNDDGFDAMIASGGGRMAVTMDRYQADWDMVRRGWETHVLGEGRRFASAAEAITAYREELHVTDKTQNFNFGTDFCFKLHLSAKLSYSDFLCALKFPLRSEVRLSPYTPKYACFPTL
jgi:2,3-bisphosphoglycerate-independent phosphoglycerate mutase